ncbi:MAG: prepilin-type N-terminal cleavage/methylation domain-containing protein [Desulfobacterales bacterium]|nr:prepilin-type N-terminal cleavage/methylation domain-containing protein [Desulfobacterales bacterium]
MKANIRKYEIGFTLIELLISMVIVSVSLTTIFGILISSRKTHYIHESSIDAQGSARIGLDFMLRDIRMARLDPTRVANAGIEEATSTKLRFTSDRNLNGVIENANDERITYELSGTSLLFRRYEGTIAATVQTLLDNVNGLTFAYWDSTGTAIAVPVSAANLSNIRTIQITLSIRKQEEITINRQLTTRIKLRN